MAIVNATIPGNIGSTYYKNEDLGGTAVVVSASATTLYLIRVDNSRNSSAVWFKAWNNAAPTVGTTAPDCIFKCPAGKVKTALIPRGMAFGTACSIACLTSWGTAGTTSPPSDVTVELYY